MEEKLEERREVIYTIEEKNGKTYILKPLKQSSKEDIDDFYAFLAELLVKDQIKSQQRRNKEQQNSDSVSEQTITAS